MRPGEVVTRAGGSRVAEWGVRGRWALKVPLGDVVGCCGVLRGAVSVVDPSVVFVAFVAFDV